MNLDARVHLDHLHHGQLELEARLLAPPYRGLGVARELHEPDKILFREGGGGALVAFLDRLGGLDQLSRLRRARDEEVPIMLDHASDKFPQVEPVGDDFVDDLEPRLGVLRGDRVGHAEINLRVDHVKHAEDLFRVDRGAAERDDLVEKALRVAQGPVSPLRDQQEGVVADGNALLVRDMP